LFLLRRENCSSEKLFFRLRRLALKYPRCNKIYLLQQNRAFIQTLNSFYRKGVISYIETDDEKNLAELEFSWLKLSWLELN